MKSPNGWVKIHRQFLEWEWFDEPNTCRLFIYCLLKANHQDKNYRGETIKRGTFVTSLEVLSKDTKISVQSIRTALNNLESTGELTSKRSRKGTVIQVVKYDEYQTLTNEPTEEQQTANKQLTTTKNEKKDNIPTAEDFVAYGLSVLPDVSIDHLRAKYYAWKDNGWVNGKGREIKNWKNALNSTLPYLPKQPKEEQSDDLVKFMQNYGR